MMRRAALLGCLWLLVAAACGPGGGAPPDTVRFNLAADPTNLNPLFLHQDANSVEQQIARLAFEPFVDLDARGRAVPALLSEIPTVANGGISADGRTLTYHLRKNVRWSDGVPVDSGDVLFTLHAILDPKNPVRSHEGYDLIDRAAAPDAHTVVFHLSRAWAPAVMTYFSYGFAPQFVLPAHVLRSQEPLAQAAFNAAPTVGDGPYTFVAWHRGDNLRYVANPRYWRGKPQIARLDISIAPDPQTNLVMLRSGQLDWNLIAPVQKAQLEGSPGIGFVSVATSVIAGLVINTTHPPYDDVRVRRAFAMSIDRATISKKITLGAYPVTDMLQPQFSWAYDPNVKEPGFDPAGAARLLDAAGWLRGPDGIRHKGGQRLELTYVQFPETVTGVRTATIAQAELRSAGFDVTLKSISSAQLYLPRTGTLASGKFDVAYVPFTMGADPDDSSILGCNGASNYARWCDARVDALESRALSAQTQSNRKALYGQIARIVAQNVPILYLFNASYPYAYRTRLHGFSPNAFLPTWNAATWRL
ncbi:MAG TPA: peptide ABC transporter substrate-binding protein [Candidatus Baltobacteraceae bacterium]